MSKQNLQETRADELKPGAVVRFAPGVATVANVSTEGGMAAVTYIGAQIPVLYPPDMRLQVLTRPTVPNPTPPPWPNPPQIPPGGPTYCCYLAAGGDECDCERDLAELVAAMASPIYLVHRTDDTWSCER